MASISEALAAALNKRNGSNDNGGGRHPIKGLAKLLAGGALVAGGARLGAPAMRGLVRVGERTANGRFLNGTRIGRFLKPFTRSAVYGDDIARLAKEKGINNVIGKDTMSRVQARISSEAPTAKKFLTDLIYKIGPNDPTNAGRLGKKIIKLKKRLYKAVESKSLEKRLLGDLSDVNSKTKLNAHLFEPAPGMTGKPGHVGATSSLDSLTFLDNKRNQALLFEQAGLNGRMPKTVENDVLDKALRRLSRSRKEDVTLYDLKKAISTEINRLPPEQRAAYKSGGRFSPGDLHIKAEGNTAGSLPPGSVDSDKGHYFTTFYRSNSPSVRYEVMKDEIKNMLVQTKMQGTTRKNSKLLDTRLGKWFDSETPVKPEFGAGRHGVEYRVHVVNGKPIIGATSSKWNPADYLNPFATKEKARLEKMIAEDFEKLMKLKTPEAQKADLAHQVLGLDVGIGKNGRPIYFELNPSMPPDMHNGSGQLLQPWIRSAVTSAIKGEMPLTQKLQLAAAALPTTIGAGSALSGYNNMMKKSDADINVGNAVSGAVGGAALGGSGMAFYGTGKGGSLLDDLRESIFSAVVKNGKINKKPAMDPFKLPEKATRIEKLKTLIKNMYVKGYNVSPDKRVLKEFGSQFVNRARRSLRGNLKPIGIATGVGATALGALGAMSRRRT